jgi:hypothetical protein
MAEWGVDDGLDYRLPADLRPSAWWVIDTHLRWPWYQEKGRDFDHEPFRAVANITGEITTQYILRYIPDDSATSDKVFRGLNIKVSLPEVKVRARKGYYPVGH